MTPMAAIAATVALFSINWTLGNLVEGKSAVDFAFYWAWCWSSGYLLGAFFWGMPS